MRAEDFDATCQRLLRIAENSNTNSNTSVSFTKESSSSSSKSNNDNISDWSPDNGLGYSQEEYKAARAYRQAMLATAYANLVYLQNAATENTTWAMNAALLRLKALYAQFYAQLS